MSDVDFFEAVEDFHKEDPSTPSDFFAAVGDLNGDPDVGRTSSEAPTLLPELKPYWETYTDPEYQAKMMPLRVIVRTDGIMAGYDNPTFDGILAHLVVDEAMEGDDLDGSLGPYLLPVPVYRLWTDPQTALPLWACNNYAPVGPSEEVTFTWHKRSIEPHHARDQKGQTTPYTYKGRHKEKRVPTPAQTAKMWYADCIGHREEVARLMDRLDVMGKCRKALVRRIEVRRIESFDMRRPVPVRYFDDDTTLERHGRMGWTPPYWAAVPQVQTECAVPA